MIDLHVHSIYSDGTNSPQELVALAAAREVSALALTDHDTVGGVKELLSVAAGSVVEAVPGIELSAECERGTMHILGYYVDHTCSELLEKVGRVRSGREARNHEILKKLNKLGYVLRWSDVEKHAGKDVVGRPHFAAALMERGLVRSKKHAFDLLLAKGRPAYHERYRYSAEECIDLIRGAGGVAVLAHPATLNLPDLRLRELMSDLKECGLGGVEAYYAEHHPENIRKYAAWAQELGLICTGGTDYHGAMTPDLKLGSGFGGLVIPEGVLDNLKRLADV